MRRVSKMAMAIVAAGAFFGLNFGTPQVKLAILGLVPLVIVGAVAVLLRRVRSRSAQSATARARARPRAPQNTRPNRNAESTTNRSSRRCPRERPYDSLRSARNSRSAGASNIS